jgi:hypothetical protein
MCTFLPLLCDPVRARSWNATGSGPCTPGYFCPTNSWNSTTALCPRANFCPLASPAPVLCLRGSYCPTAGLSIHTLCTVGFYCATRGLVAPTGACPTIQHCPDPGSAGPICPAGAICLCGEACQQTVRLAAQVVTGCADQGCATRAALTPQKTPVPLAPASEFRHDWAQHQASLVSTTAYPSTTTAPIASDAMVLFRSFPPLTVTVTRLQYWGRWKDQGFGNRKGKVYLRLNRSGTLLNTTTTDLTPGRFAPHTQEIFTGTLDEASSALVATAAVGDRLELWAIVGAGQQHKLTVNNFRVTLNDVATNTFF